MKKNILLIVNPIAGNINVTSVTTKVEKEAKRHDYKVDIFKTTGENDAVLITEKLSSANYNRILVAGGDGTVNLVGSVIEGEKITLGILSCGSANGLATALKLPNSIEEQIPIALFGEPISMDSIDINNNICLHISDIGINAELVYNFDKGERRGLLGYLFQIIPTLSNSRYPYKFTIHLKDKKIKKKGILLALANASKYGTGAVINPNGTVNDGKFEIVIFKKLSFIHILKTFFSTSKLHPRFAESYCVNEATIRCETPLALQVDGEYLGEFNEIKATINQGAIQVAVP